MGHLIDLAYCLNSTYTHSCLSLHCLLFTDCCLLKSFFINCFGFLWASFLCASLKTSSSFPSAKLPGDRRTSLALLPNHFVCLGFWGGLSLPTPSAPPPNLGVWGLASLRPGSAAKTPPGLRERQSESRLWDFTILPLLPACLPGNSFSSTSRKVGARRIDLLRWLGCSDF